MKKKYTFSIIMSIYNVDAYLEEAVESIINQDIGFEKNVQLIFINDGSTDNSENICRKYLEKYPNNIKYIYKENGGLSSAKNTGLKYVEGEYVNFMDPDDTLPLNTLTEVYKFFDKHSLCIDFVTLPLVFFEAQKGLHPKYKYMGEKNAIIDLNATPYNFILSSAASFYKKEIITKFTFNETYLGEEDTLLNGTLYLQNPRFGYVCQKGVKYNYRRRFTKNSIVDSSAKNPKNYYTVIELLNTIVTKENIKDYQQELIIYELRSRLKSIKKEYFKTEKEYGTVIKEFTKFIKLLDSKYILYSSKFCDSLNLKVLFMSLKGEKDKLNELLYTNCKVMIQKVELIKNKIKIDVNYNKFNLNNIDLLAFNAQQKIYKQKWQKDYNGVYDVKIGDFIIDETHIKRFEFDLKKIKKIKFIIKDTTTDKYYPLKEVTINSKLAFSGCIPHIFYKNYKIRFDGQKFIIKKVDRNNYISILKENIISIITIESKRKFLAFSRIFNRRNKKYVLINDRDNKAGDNGEALFKYLYKEKPAISKLTYFVIDKKAEDYRRLKKIGKVVALGSLKHKILFLNAKYIYSSHMMPEYFNAYKIDNLKYYKDLFNYKFIWLQHGVTMNNISVAANCYRKKIDCITCATLAEADEFKKDQYCYEENKILLSGFARYDLLKNTPKNIITIAPTWRKYICEKIDTVEDFKETEYYQMYKEILTNKELKKLCKEKTLKVNFILHSEMLKYINVFKELSDDIINILTLNEINYSQVFEESKLLITDYSSVFFDFSYLQKPVIFFQFDRVDFFEKHYERGYFSYENDGFGSVIEKTEDIIKKISYYIDNDFSIEQEYLNRINKTFKYTDKNNCQRIIEMTYKK